MANEDAKVESSSSAPPAVAAATAESTGDIGMRPPSTNNLTKDPLALNKEFEPMVGHLPPDARRVPHGYS